MSKAASDYLNNALALMQQHALHTDEIEWTALRREAIAHAAHAKDTIDTYAALYYALGQLREHHSGLRLSDNLTPEQQARIAKMRALVSAGSDPSDADIAESVFLSRTRPTGHIIHSGPTTLALIAVPECIGKYASQERNLSFFAEYGKALHAIAVELADRHPTAWIVDLRGNDGGNVWPMLAGIGIVLGQGLTGSLVLPHQRLIEEYRAGVASLDGKNMNEFTLEPPFSLPTQPYVAVLIDGDTASSGEGVAIAFKGRPHTRFFGSKTFGLASSNIRLPLSDGAVLFINNAVDADRDGSVYENGLMPDVIVAQPTKLPQERDDAALQAAISWLTLSPR